MAYKSLLGYFSSESTIFTSLPPRRLRWSAGAAGRSSPNRVPAIRGMSLLVLARIGVRVTIDSPESESYWFTYVTMVPRGNETLRRRAILLASLLELCFIPGSWRRLHVTCFFRTWCLAVNFDWLHIWFRAAQRWWCSPKHLRRSISFPRGTMVTYVTWDVLCPTCSFLFHFLSHFLPYSLLCLSLSRTYCLNSWFLFHCLSKFLSQSPPYFLLWYLPHFLPRLLPYLLEHTNFTSFFLHNV